ncbi:MAG: hypothetical protein RJB25_941 [Bacteroidota bacterium]
MQVEPEAEIKCLLFEIDLNNSIQPEHQALASQN